MKEKKGRKKENGGIFEFTGGDLCFVGCILLVFTCRTMDQIMYHARAWWQCRYARILTLSIQHGQSQTFFSIRVTKWSIQWSTLKAGKGWRSGVEQHAEVGVAYNNSRYRNKYSPR